MSNDSTPVARISFTTNKVRHGVLTVWTSRFGGVYSIRRDRPNDRYPSIGLIEALTAWAKGDGYLDLTIESQREPRGGRRGSSGGGGYGDGGFDKDIPFVSRNKRGEW